LAIVRHAKARKRSAWDGAEQDRPLTQAGRSAAKALAPVLAAYGVQRVHSSPAVRCLSTVRPYAKLSGLAVLVEPTLDEEAFAGNPAAALERAAQLAGDTAAGRLGTAVCTHRPAIPALVSHLLEGSGLAGPTETFPPASLLVLHLATGTLVASEFHTVT
jgi:8-oxo-dGTP diphosphatase